MIRAAERPLRTCRVMLIQVDVRTPGNDVPRWKLSADVEALTWHPHQPTCFLVSSEDGIVACFDARKGAGEGAVQRR